MRRDGHSEVRAFENRHIIDGIDHRRIVDEGREVRSRTVEGGRDSGVQTEPASRANQALEYGQRRGHLVVLAARQVRVDGSEAPRSASASAEAILP